MKTNMLSVYVTFNQINKNKIFWFFLLKNRHHLNLSKNVRNPENEFYIFI